EEELVPGAERSGFGDSPGNGNFFEAGSAGAFGVGEYGAWGTPLRPGAEGAGALGELDAGSPGNGNFSVALGFLDLSALPEFAGLLPQGSGCGITLHGAGLGCE